MAISHQDLIKAAKPTINQNQASVLEQNIDNFIRGAYADKTVEEMLSSSVLFVEKLDEVHTSETIDFVLGKYRRIGWIVNLTMTGDNISVRFQMPPAKVYRSTYNRNDDGALS